MMQSEAAPTLTAWPVTARVSQSRVGYRGPKLGCRGQGRSGVRPTHGHVRQVGPGRDEAAQVLRASERAATGPRTPRNEVAEMAPLRAESGAAFFVLQPVANAPYGKAPTVIRKDAAMMSTADLKRTHRRSER